MLPADLAKYRSAPVRVASTSLPTVSTNTILGSYCANGHFTDSRKIRCLYCLGEVEFGRFGSGERPLLGVLEFDTGAITELTQGVVIGRKPTLQSGESAHLVSFVDDMMLSRVHTEVKLVDWDVVVIDRQSANGTSIVHVDGRSVSARPNLETTIEDGTMVKFGNHSFRFRRQR
jgi:FHA domain